MSAGTSTKHLTPTASTERIRGTKVTKPIVYGNRAERLSEKTKEGHTHQWTLFVKPFYDEDISKYIKKVQFKLHETYSNSLRVIEKPPFEVTETGWGEFEVQIKLYFTDVNEKQLTTFYFLRLYAPVVTIKGHELVLNQVYDELIFNEPTAKMHAALTASSNPKPGKHHIDYTQRRKELMEKLTSANNELLAEISDLRDSLQAAVALHHKHRIKHEEAQSQQQQGGGEGLDTPKLLGAEVDGNTESESATQSGGNPTPMEE